jgi:hypothetical protein
VVTLLAAVDRAGRNGNIESGARQLDGHRLSDPPTSSGDERDLFCHHSPSVGTTPGAATTYLAPAWCIRRGQVK